jgi:ammonium transporter, Amt family
VHIASGAAGLAYALVTGKRSGYGQDKFKPHSLSTVILGTALLWFGWFGFNGGAGLAANARAGLAIVNSNFAACAGGLTWVMWDFKKTKKFSAFGFCSGVIAGLVSITPAAGFVQPYYSIVFGCLGALGCNIGIELKNKFGFGMSIQLFAYLTSYTHNVDDALDAFGVHGIGGIIGSLLTGIFASKSAAATGGVVIPGGWVDGNFILLGYQLAAVVVTFLWAFCLTYLILYLLNKSKYLKVRLSVEDEKLGTDASQLGETANQFMEQVVSMAVSSPVLNQAPQPHMRGGSANNSGLFQTMITGGNSHPVKTATISE